MVFLPCNALHAMFDGGSDKVIIRARDYHKNNLNKTNLLILFIACHNNPYILFKETLVDIIPELGFAYTVNYNPLIRAVRAQDYELCEFLLKCGISPSFKACGQMNAFEANKLDSNEDDLSFISYEPAPKAKIYKLLKRYDKCPKVKLESSEPLGWMKDINQVQGEYRLF